MAQLTNNAKWKIGDIYAIQLKDDASGFGRLLDFPLCEFFEYFGASNDFLAAWESSTRPVVAFRVWVMRAAMALFALTMEVPDWRRFVVRDA